jgi:hypothetical protein
VGASGFGLMQWLCVFTLKRVEAHRYSGTLEDGLRGRIYGDARSSNVSLEVGHGSWIENSVGFNVLVYGDGAAKRVPGAIEGYLFLNLRRS